MLYPVCPTCHFFLADKELIFENKRDIINNDNNIKNKNLEIEKLVISLGIQRYCCKMRIISFVDQVKLII